MEIEHTLLIVDDEPNVIKSLKRLLVDTDYRILSAQSGEEALQLFEKHEIRLVLSDYRMPGMSGVEFLSRVKDQFPDTIRIILSGYADVESIVEAINKGHIYHFISKPWNDQDLLTTIAHAFDQFELQRENEKLTRELKFRNEELEKLTKCLEDKVVERTRDLEIRNRALHVAQSILNLLPVGVLGIDIEETVVYTNSSLRDYINVDKIGLGMPAQGTIGEDVRSMLQSAIADGEKQRAIIDEEHGVGLVVTPLQNQAGAIGLYYFLDIEKYCSQPTRQVEKSGVVNAKQL